MVEHIGNSFVILGYNGRDGVVTDKNGLIYMRARYYSPEMRRFINADILHGEISDSTSLNRYSYVNGNPVSFVDPFGLSAERNESTINSFQDIIKQIKEWFKKTFGVAVTIGSEYDVFSFDNFFGDIETGFSLNKEYKGNYKPIEFLHELSSTSSSIKDEVGIKVNFNDKSGFKLSFGVAQMSFECANENNYFEFMIEPNRIGFTTSQDVDWKDYSVGSYTSYYVRPLSFAATAAVAVGVAVAMYYTGGAAAGVLASAMTALIVAG